MFKTRKVPLNKYKFCVEANSEGILITEMFPEFSFLNIQVIESQQCL